MTACILANPKSTAIRHLHSRDYHIFADLVYIAHREQGRLLFVLSIDPGCLVESRTKGILLVVISFCGQKVRNRGTKFVLDYHVSHAELLLKLLNDAIPLFYMEISFIFAAFDVNGAHLKLMLLASCAICDPIVGLRNLLLFLKFV